MQTVTKTALVLGAMLGCSGAGAFAQAPARDTTPAATPPAAATRAAAVNPSSYWGPAPSKRKPSVFQRLMSRWGGGEGSSSESEVKVYRDPTTGRTNTMGTKPWMESGR